MGNIGKDWMNEKGGKLEGWEGKVEEGMRKDRRDGNE